MSSDFALVSRTTQEMKDQKASSSFSTTLASQAEPWEAPVHHQCCHTQACRVSPVSPVQGSQPRRRVGIEVQLVCSCQIM